jgi:hypothetical protein
MRYSAYVAIAGTTHSQLMSRDTAQGPIDLITTFANQLQQGQTPLTLSAVEQFAEVQQIDFVRNEAAALFTVECTGGYRLHVLAQSGYITGLTNSADQEMFARLRSILIGYGQGWEPSHSATPIDPPAYYCVFEATEPTKIGAQEELLRRLFPLAEALAIAFFYTIRLDGPDAYEWEDPNRGDDDP